MSKVIISKCGTCGNGFSVTGARVAALQGRFCSRPCADAAKRLYSGSPDRIAERFWRLVDKNGPVLRVELGPCWVWKGATVGRGYGKIGMSKRTTALAHRVAFLLEHGRWPQPLALHKCDGGDIGCVRASHLFEGTYRDNARDRVSKGRSLRGENSPTSKLTERDVHAIRVAVGAGLRYGVIAEQFRITRATVCDIVRGRRWGHLQAP